MRYCAYIPDHAESHRQRTLNAALYRRCAALWCALPMRGQSAVDLLRHRCGFAVAARLRRC
ncbi:hypothetical protein [Azospirillum sp. B506]|uniref:hypothetical protein n=1 Tax=Azospirillum sp. B506 TaxID=137721 RepID=UPI00034D5AC5|nr:hypothetical protein [Azospirillum sp. B506]